MSAETSTPETREQRLARFQAGMKTAGAPVAATSDAPPAAPAPAPAAAQPTGSEAAANAAAESASAAATPTESAPPAAAPTPAPWWKTKVKVLDEDREIDLEQLARENPAGFQKLIGQGLSHDTIRERLRSARDASREELETERRTRAALEKAVAATGGRIERDPASGELRIVGPTAPTSAAGTGAAGQPDLAELEKRARETNTNGAWLDYTSALRQRLEAVNTIAPNDVERIVETKLRAARDVADAQDKLKGEVQAFADKVDARIRANMTKFEKAPEELRARYIHAARERAFAVSGRPVTKDQPNPATEEEVLAVFDDQADLVARTWTAAQQQLSTDAARPRPKPPTVLPPGGQQPNAAVTDPKAIDRSTPAGRAQAIAHLEQLRQARNGQARVAV